MKYIFMALISQGILGVTYADEQPKKVSFGDGNHTYKSHYKNNNNSNPIKSNIDRANEQDENNRSLLNKQDSSKQFAEELEDLNS
jgi:hypothetical protein